ncbi:MAG: SIS domain-containing protein [Candidatus Coatesbacteria bacterium]|nr:MAG: SIS domain-containing protein [Candidatus Coatesbacteria bacterium]
MDPTDRIRSELETTAKVIADSAPAVAGPLAELARVVAERLRAGGKLLAFGNGGSAADAQHLAAEFVVRLGRDRPAMAAVALTTDTSILTASANDYGYEEVFARQMEALGRAGDVALGLSTSGNSENVRRALVRARELELYTAAFLGAGGGTIAPVVDLAVVVPSDDTQRIQEVHIAMCHALTSFVEDITETD